MKNLAGLAALAAILYATAAGGGPHTGSTGTTGKVLDDAAAVVVAQAKSRGEKRGASQVRQKPEAQNEARRRKGHRPEGGQAVRRH